MTGYENIIYGTIMCAIAVCLAFLVLVLRRYVSERKRAKRDDRDTAVTRSYLQRVAGQRAAATPEWKRSTRLAAISRILPLLRGGERTRLLQIAEFDGVLRDVLRRSHSVARAERISSIHLLQRFGSEACVARLRQMMARDRSARVRLEAAFALGANGALPPPREMLRILGWHNRLPSRLDIALLRSAAPLYPEQMMLLLDDNLSSAWRAQVVDALGWSGDMQVITVLEGLADDPDPEIRCAVLRASSRLGHPASAKWTSAGLGDDNTAVRLQAIAASRRLGLTEAVPQLMVLRDDAQLWVRLRAEQALEQLAPALDAPATIAPPPIKAVS